MSATGRDTEGGPTAKAGPEQSREAAFMEWLQKAVQSDSRVRAVLRRSLAFEPGACVQAYPYVERFVREEAGSWERKAYYLAAGLWAQHTREGQGPGTVALATACARYAADKKSDSTERRFINLLDADPDQLSYRLRQMTALLKEYPLDFVALLRDLRWWGQSDRRVQSQWARQFYQAAPADSAAE